MLYKALVNKRDYMNAIVTGARRGIGRAVVKKFIENGINVWATTSRMDDSFIEDMKRLESEVSDSQSLGSESVASSKLGKIIPIELELRSEDSIKAAVKAITSERDENGNKLSIDILVNNAGIPSGGLMQMTSMDTLRDVMEVNFIGQMSLIQKISKVMMRQKKGAVVNIGSVGGIEAREGYLAYGSSKAAFMWATRCISKELAPYNIRVNAVAPGLVDTEMGDYKADAEQQKILDAISMKRKGTPEEIAEVVYFLSTDASSFITGSIINADGGRLI